MVGKTSTQVKNRWNYEHYDRVVILLEKEDAERYKKKCTEKGLTFSDIPKAAIMEFIDRED